MSTIKEWIERYDEGSFNSLDDLAYGAGWQDWMCKDSALSYHTMVLSKYIKQLAKSPMISSTYRVCLFNIKPKRGMKYDIIQILDSVGRVLYNVTPRSTDKESCYKKAVVYSYENGFKFPVVNSKWTKVKKYFKLNTHNFKPTVR
jgi:hypothetical protein